MPFAGVMRCPRITTRMGTSRSAAHRGQKRSHLASLGRGTEFQEAQHPDPEAAVRCTLPGLGRAPVRVVARLNQRREYRAWSEIVGPWTLGCTLSDAELKNVKKHSTENLRQLCAELFLYDWLGQHSEDSRPAMVVRLIKHRLAQCHASEVPPTGDHDVWQPQSATCPSAVRCDDGGPGSR